MAAKATLVRETEFIFNRVFNLDMIDCQVVLLDMDGTMVPMKKTNHYFCLEPYYLG